MQWVLACFVLHNMCNALGDGEFTTGVDADADTDVLPVDAGAEESRSRVKRDVLSFMRARGQYKS